MVICLVSHGEKKNKIKRTIGHLAQDVYLWCTTSATLKGYSVLPQSIFTGLASIARNLEGA